MPIKGALYHGIQSKFHGLEDGNLPFGSYGKKSSVISFKGQVYSYPVLISREVSKFLKDNEHEAVI